LPFSSIDSWIDFFVLGSANSQLVPLMSNAAGVAAGAVAAISFAALSAGGASLCFEQPASASAVESLPAAPCCSESGR
jgi:hypothetical protein